MKIFSITFTIFTTYNLWLWKYFQLLLRFLQLTTYLLLSFTIYEFTFYNLQFMNLLLTIYENNLRLIIFTTYNLWNYFYNLWNYYYNFYDLEFMKLLSRFMKLLSQFLWLRIYENIFTIMKIFSRLIIYEINLQLIIYENTFTFYNLWNYYYNFYDLEFMKLLSQFLWLRIYENIFTTYNLWN